MIDDKSTDNTLAVLRDARDAVPADAADGVPAQRRFGHRPPHRHADARGADRRVDRRRHDLPNERIPEFVQYLEEHPHVDQVVGARTSEQGTYKFLRVPAKWTIRKIAEGLSGTKIPDLNSGLRAFRRDGVAAVPAPASARVQLRDDHHDGVPVQPAHGRVPAHRVREAGR